MKKLKLIPLIVVLALAGYCTMTPTGALRFRIAVSGYPVKAVTSVIQNETYAFAKSGQTGYSLYDPPVEKATGSELVNWVVTKHGVFYTARYFGWS